jgi:drug/metabolite transporter (DMT)-like permease
MFNFNYFLVVGTVAVIACGQIIFKFAALQLQFDPRQPWIEQFRINVVPVGWVLFALGLYLIATVAWIQALRNIPLSVAYMFNALAFIIVPFAGFILFGEQMPRYFLPSAAMIIGGIILVSMG